MRQFERAYMQFLPVGETGSHTYRAIIPDLNFVPHAVSVWWDEICRNEKRNPRGKQLEYFGYHIIELAKNAREYSEKSTIEVKFSDQKITAIVLDDGPGFDPTEELYPASGGFGLFGVAEWADDFVIETGGKRYERTKVNGILEIIKTGSSGISVGAKITFSRIVRGRKKLAE